MKPKIKPFAAQRKDPTKNQTAPYKNPSMQRNGNANRKGKPKLDQAPRQYKTRQPNPERIEKDTAEFIQAIHEAAETLDFAMQMYGKELEAQLFTDEEITDRQRAAFRQVAVKIINGN